MQKNKFLCIIYKFGKVLYERRKKTIYEDTIFVSENL